MTNPPAGDNAADRIDGNCIVDRARLASISEGDREFELELLEAYLEDSRDCLAAIDAAMSASDWEKLASFAHQLKGASGNVGAEHMRKLCAQLEQDARANRQSSTVQSLLQGLEAVKAVAQQW